MLESTISSVSYVGDGAKTEFSFPFKVWDKSQVQVLTSTAIAGVEDDITDSVTITLNEDDVEAGGTVKFAVAPSSSTTFTISRNMPFTQNDSYISGSRFDPAVIEDRFDKDCAERQQLLEQVKKVVVLPSTYSGSSDDLIADILTSQQILVQATSYKAGQSCVVKVTEATTEPSVYTLTNCWYRVGYKQLFVSIDGAVLSNNYYEEVGEFGDLSCTVQINPSLYVGQEIYFQTVPADHEEESLIAEISATVSPATGYECILYIKEKSEENNTEEDAEQYDRGEVYIDGEESGGNGAPKVGEVGYVYTIPGERTYLYGRHQLRVIYEGIVLDKRFYEEVEETEKLAEDDALGQPLSRSSKVKINVPLEAGDAITFFITPLGTTDVSVTQNTEEGQEE